MRAVVRTAYGPPEVLELAELADPVPSDGEVLIRIHAASVTAGDCEMRRLKLPLGLSFPMRLYSGWRKPVRLRIPGQELSGTVIATGKDVKAFQEGDQVFGTTGFTFGACSEFICLPAHPGDAQGVLTTKPENLTFEEAAVLPTAGMEVLHYFREAGTQAGDKVLIIGAGGSIGTLAVQYAVHLGADVTAVDRAVKRDFLLDLGAERFIDHTAADLTNKNGPYDLVIDLVGQGSVRRRLGLLKWERGMYFLAFAHVRHILLGLAVRLLFGKRLRLDSSKQRNEELEELRRFAQQGILKPVVDRSFPLEEIVEANRYCESGAKRGSVAITVIKE